MARSTALTDRSLNGRSRLGAEDIHVHLGSRLRQARTRAGLTLVALAKAAAVPSTALARYEAGVGQMSVDKLMTLADALRLNPIYFFGDSDDDCAKGFGDLAQALPVRDAAESRALVEAYDALPHKVRKTEVRHLLRRISARAVH